MSTPADRLAAETYVSLETFKKDGTGVPTPVWVAGLDGKLVVVTDGSSYKVKRLRRNGRVRVAPCDVRGKLRGDWVEGTCVILEDPARAQAAYQALRAKYGWQFAMLDLGAKLSGSFKRRKYLEITV